ncbi:hypothetical protein BCR32DRAFT_115348 [Anaeromyces robustus]|uniref:Chitin-binding type-1 domain-containing protein n=1 Tax=Anaeromyces robustus TaxID=1754192 RepID=A0A1Y1VVW3_9FUNG|nr:hypothetical protein BCR32DRAFT_115348 [Anaeromyces robustus]|eukprot:ORX65343.1 hypothetical protein BCR32DRAFT_115348 [Anaeromyces robustus]
MDKNGNKVEDKNEQNCINPITECLNYAYTGMVLRLRDCKTTAKKATGNSNSFLDTWKFDNKKFDGLLYFADGEHRILTTFGWCAYNNDTGKCGKNNGLNCRSNYCCSKYGYCGQSNDYCDKKNCNGSFGMCH